VLEAGDAYYFDSRQPHRFRNVHDQECELISVCTPPSFWISLPSGQGPLTL